MRNERVIKGSIGFTMGGKPTEKPRKALPPPEPDPMPDDEPEASPEATESAGKDNAIQMPLRLYRGQIDAVDRLRTTISPGSILSRAAAIRWLIDRWARGPKP